MATTTLYRFFDRHDRLLYVGIAGNPARRHHEHSKSKPWWGEVARSTMEHFPTREEAAVAEVAAIRSESPLHNVVHNEGRGATAAKHPCPLPTAWRPPDASGPFVISDRYGQSFTTRLVLRPEIHLSPCVDDVQGRSDDPWDQGRLEVEHWFARLASDNHGVVPEFVGIYWVVDGLDTARVFDTAPLGSLWGNEYQDLDDFLAHFSWPMCARTGQPLNWLHLPVLMDRFPLFADALGWCPSPLQATCPARALHAMFHNMVVSVTRGEAAVHRPTQTHERARATP